MDALTNVNWPMVGVALSAIGVSFAALTFLINHRERQRNAAKSKSAVKATIDKTEHGHGWRGVQLHIGPATGDWTAFRVEDYRIERARLVRPRGAVLARAAGDDYASGVFYSEHQTRTLEGKEEGRPQRFALEFFIKAPRHEQDAKFKVIYSRVDGAERRTTTVIARIPSTPVA